MCIRDSHYVDQKRAKDLFVKISKGLDTSVRKKCLKIMDKPPPTDDDDDDTADGAAPKVDMSKPGAFKWTVCCEGVGCPKC